MESYYQKNRIRLIGYSKQKKIEALRLKKFYCVDCDQCFYDKTRLTNHLKSMKHNPKRYVKYTCEVCPYMTTKKPRYTLHLQSKKHTANVVACH